MAKIYKFEGYVVAANDEDIDIEYLFDRYTDGKPFMLETHCGCEEFEWDDDLEINYTNDYWVADKLYCRLGYDRAVKELKESKQNWDMKMDEPLRARKIDVKEAEAIDKQKPKRVIIHEEDGWYYAQCPNCLNEGTRYSLGNDENKASENLKVWEDILYCSKCGQRLDWREDVNRFCEDCKVRIGADVIDELVIAYIKDEEQYDGCKGCQRMDDYCCIQCFRDRFLEQLKE